MTRRGRRVALALVLAALGLNLGCISAEYVESIQRIDVKAVMLSTEGPNGFRETVRLGYTVGSSLTGTLLVVLFLLLGHQVMSGKGGWQGSTVEKELYWAMACVALLASVAGPGVGGMPEWIWRSTDELSRIFEPVGGSVGAQESSARRALSNFVTRLQGVPPPTTGGGETDGLTQLIQANQFMSLHPAAVAGTTVNAVALPCLRFLMNVSWAVLVIIYWTLTPLVLPTMILPQTRSIFVGWVRSYVGVCLWPLFFHLLERLAAVLPWANWAGTERAIELLTRGTLASIPEAVGYWVRGQFVVAMLNITFLLMYLAVPIISGRLVGGASNAIKAGFF